MLDRLIDASIRGRLAVIVLTVVLVAGGLLLTEDMAVDVLPDVSSPVVTVLTEVPGMAPEEVEQMITYPVEAALVGSEGVRRVTSTSIQGFSSVQVEFDWNVGMQEARQTVTERLQGVGGTLPDQAGTPFLAPVTSIMGEIMLVGFTADTTSQMELRTLVDFTVRRELLAMPGVAAISVYGGDRQQFVVEPDPDRLEQAGVSLARLLEATGEASSTISGGFFTSSGYEYPIRGFGRVGGLDDLRSAFVAMGTDGVPLLLGDFAELRMGAVPPIGGASINALPGIILVISKEPAANTVQLTRDIEDRLESLAATLPADVEIHPDLFQQAHFIELAIRNVRNALILGGLLVILVLFAFLASWRTTVISLAAIPTSVLLTVLVLRATGMTFNTMTLGGIAIAVGVLVDDAIVFVENVFRRLSENQELAKAEQAPFMKVVGEAAREIKGPIVLANFTIVVVFLPLLFLTGLEGRLLLPLGIAYVTTIVASLLVALTLTPALSAWLLADIDEGVRGRSWLSRRLDALYHPVLRWSLGHRVPILAGVTILLVGSLALVPGMGRSFLPEFNEGTLNVGLATLPGTSLEESERFGVAVEEILLAHPSVISTGRRVGRAEMDEHAMGSHGHELEVRLHATGLDMAEFMEEMREALAVVPGTNISLDQPITHRIDHMLTGVRTNLAVKLFGPDRERLQALSRELEEIMRGEGDIRDILTDEQTDVPQLQILPDRDRLALHGLSMAQFGAVIETAVGGRIVDQIFLDPAVFDLVVRLPERYRASPEDVARVPVTLPGGERVRIDDLAEVRVSFAPNSISRENASRMLVTQANIVGGDLRGTVTNLREAVSERLDLSGGYVVSFEGQFQQEEEATRTILLVSLLSLLLIFLALYLQFGSASQAVLILLNLPLALVGGILVVRLGDGILSIAVLIGFITLFGIAVRNGIILISEYNRLVSEEGKSAREAVLEGSRSRLQPILMTVITTALALTPLALAASRPGNEIQGPMAAVILGGLVSATLLNMIVVPMLFDWYFGERMAAGRETRPLEGR
ncbi:MAG: efflux RND transporter permease subunit [Gemmatimonadales bacterium]|nr:MAG: efflux RND transporter permease subunit [Gemmatimonadales bacterium]